MNNVNVISDEDIAQSYGHPVDPWSGQIGDTTETVISDENVAQDYGHPVDSWSGDHY